ncbi:hypothetical protein M413DRAFT_29263 [Hebeloma cylindrosporum]|uniref:F-box domain-containing protein n=1 Tax=Hebeloma cylindrosporum TaxID=76867 RepID=A0A0C3BS64_HEBCY|nr:hypothetical protein M413DRAFT_29263 [Hebeloma cylindrosporum h7]
MLNPPLSLLSDDLIGYLVEHIANEPFPIHFALHNLSLADRAFRDVCQKYIFRSLTLGTEWATISAKMRSVKGILDDNPLFAHHIRKIHLYMRSGDNSWLFQNPGGKDLRDEEAVTFISFFHLLANSPMPPHELHLTMGTFPIEDPVLLVRQISQSFFSQTLTILHLTGCSNVPLTLFIVCRRLKEVRLDMVGAIEETYDNYPDEQCSTLEAPELEVFECQDSTALIEQLITPPPRFHRPVVLWSKLRVLTMCPQNQEEMDFFRSILDAGGSSLEELYLLTAPSLLSSTYTGEQLSLAGFVRLRVFALYTFFDGYTPELAPFWTINPILGTISTSNTVTNLIFDLRIFVGHPFDGSRDDDWVGMCNEAIRISSGKHLELDVKIHVNGRQAEEEDLYMGIMETIKVLSDHPEICTHFWYPTQPSPPARAQIPRGQARARCTK